MEKRKDRCTMYKISRVVLGALYRFWYRPIIVGAENIPKTGRFIIVGNHIHIMDQCNVIIPTRRVIRYMAKKEYFDPQYPEGHFGWFFRSSGCIPVDRSKKDEVAVETAIDVLEHDHGLGLFPEGTRNGLKEASAKELFSKYVEKDSTDFETFYERARKNRTSFIDYLEELMKKEIITKEEFINNLSSADAFMGTLVKEKRISEDDYFNHIFLPFKFGAVSMAQKTQSVIVPFVITGDYKFRSKNLKVTIGKPLKPMDDLGKANQRLEDVMRKMMKENHIINGK